MMAVVRNKMKIASDLEDFENSTYFAMVEDWLQKTNHSLDFTSIQVEPTPH